MGQNICVIGASEGKQEVEELFEEIMMENISNMMEEIDLKPREAQSVPKARNPKRPTPRHIIIKMPKVKYEERILKAAREKPLVTYKGAPIKLAAYFSKETMQDRRAWQKIVDRMKTQYLQPKILFLTKLSFRVEGLIKSFPDKNKLKEFIITKLILQKMLTGLL
uniref:Uncharacterized protein n=1 Tax=Rousettus aegyptiacus TaxID=9407 RepID=A0A7J8F0R7_ROUAE|nr:hypothetical protein HJG63_012325 [Rousettus aegyptiacus]